MTVHNEPSTELPLDIPQRKSSLAAERLASSLHLRRLKHSDSCEQLKRKRADSASSASEAKVRHVQLRVDELEVEEEALLIQRDEVFHASGSCAIFSASLCIFVDRLSFRLLCPSHHPDE
jgi:hypothetical protein